MTITLSDAPSEQALALIRRFEGFSPVRYSCPAGKSTIGYGHVVQAGEKIGNTITLTQAETLLKADAAHAARAVSEAVTVGLTQAQRDALTSFVFNIGASAFARSSLCQIINRGWHAEVPQQLLRWVYIQGKPSKGLVERRRVEGELYGKKESKISK